MCVYTQHLCKSTIFLDWHLDLMLEMMLECEAEVALKAVLASVIYGAVLVGCMSMFYCIQLRLVDRMTHS